MIEGFLAAVGLKLQNVIVGAVGSGVSMRFYDAEGWAERLATFAGGLALAAWGGPPLADYLEVTKYETGVVLLCGLFGMAAAGEMMNFIRGGGLKGLVPSIFRRGGGENNKGA